MPPQQLDPKINGNSGAGHPVPPALPEPSPVQELGQELAELARNLSGPLHRLLVRNGDCEIEVEWHAPAARAVVDGPPAAAEATSLDRPSAGGPALDGVGDPPDPGTVIRSPLVGTYFAAAAPDAEPFVRPGDEVHAGQTLAIVEAMKMMNSVVADEPGTVVEILVVNGQSVEFDQPLLRVRPLEPPT